MKKLKKLSAILVVMLVLFSAITTTAFAADVSQDGLEVSLITDKEAYEQGEQIAATLTVKNTNDFAVKNVTLESLIPDGYVLADGSSATKELDSLEPGETAELAVTFIAKGETPTDPTNPTDPTDPTEPTDPVEPTETDEPVDSDFTDNGVWKIVFPIMGVTGFVAIIIALANFKKILALILAAIIGGSFITGGIFKASAEDDEIRNISIETNVDVAGEIKKIIGNISYSYDEPEKEDVEIYNKPISEENIETLDNGISYIRDEILLTAKSGVAKSEVEKLVKECNGKIVGYISLTNDYQIQLKNVNAFEELERFSKELSESTLIDQAIINYVEKTDLNFYPSDPYDGDKWNEILPGGKNWAPEAVNAPGAWDYKNRLSTVRLGIIDSMFDTSHEDLNIFTGALWNNPSNVIDLYNADKEKDIYYHGTHVAGIAAARFDNERGISGIAPNAKAYGYAMYGNTKYSGLMDWKVALGKMLSNGIKVVNISMGYDELCEKASKGDVETIELLNDCSLSLSKYLEKWIYAGCDFVICQAAGNGNANNSFEALAKYGSFFANIKENKIKDRIIVVGSAYKEIALPSYKLASYSNVGDRVDVIAPGEDVYSCFPDNEYKSIGGTSMASPIVAGIAAMVWGANRNLTGSEVKWIIKNTTFNKVGGTDVKMVNAEIAVQVALNVTGNSDGNIQQNNGIINGEIVTRESDRISDAWVSITSEDGYNLVFHEQADALGEFSAILPEGKYKVTVWHPDYEELKNVEVEIKKGEAIFQSFVLDYSFAGGDGTKENPYQVSTPEQLNAVRNDLDAHYIQINDIDMTDWGNWEPIGKVTSWFSGAIGAPDYKPPIESNDYFRGTYDGNNYRIKGLQIENIDTSVEDDCFGLFAGLENATVKNLYLTDISYTIDKILTDYSLYWENDRCIYTLTVGGIAGRCNSSIISNCSVSGSISVINCPDVFVGGISGCGSITTNCNSNTEILVLANKDSRYKNDAIVYCGGIVGRTITVLTGISYCENKGTINVTGSKDVVCGGISGKYGSITNCTNYGDIDATVTHGYWNAGARIGEILGDLSSSEIPKDCVNYGNIKQNIHKE